MSDPYVQSISPSSHGVKIEWAGTDAVWHEVEPAGEIAIPLETMWTTEVARVRGEVRGVYKTEKPEPAGSLPLLWYPVKPGDPLLDDFLTGLITSPTATNASARAGVAVQSAVKCCDIRITLDSGVEGGSLTRYVMTACELQRDAQGVTPGATGTTVTYALTGHGTITRSSV